jgi:glycosyltransferase involved in cell wall biosynthesis
LPNWEKRLVIAYQKLAALLNDYTIQIILVNDGSLDEIKAQDLAYIRKHIEVFQYIDKVKNEGKGAALRKGFAKSSSPYSLFTDIDFPYDEKNVVAMVHKLEKGADIVIGKREETYYSKVPFLRRFVSKGFKCLIKVFFKLETTDTQAGLKAFSEKGKEILLNTTTHRYLFDLELVKRASKQRLKFEFITLDLKDGVVLSALSYKIMLSEFKNLLQLIFIK